MEINDSVYSVASDTRTAGSALGRKAHQIAHEGSRVIESPGLQEKASRNSGMLATTPLMRNGAGEWVPVRTITRSVSGDMLPHQVCA